MIKKSFVEIALLLGLSAATPAQIEESPMKITSTAFSQGGDIPSKFTCDQENTNPDLEFTGIPAAAKSLVLIVDDPDAPAGTFTHWLVWNLPPGEQKIMSGGLPRDAVEGVNDAGKTGYMGPCPPSGTHRYFFRLYALDTMLDLKAGAARAKLEKAMQNHVLAQASLMGRYARKR